MVATSLLWSLSYALLGAIFITPSPAERDYFQLLPKNRGLNLCCAASLSPSLSYAQFRAESAIKSLLIRFRACRASRFFNLRRPGVD